MSIRLLVSISEDASTFNGIKFVNSFFSDKSRLKITLICSPPKDSAVCALEQSSQDGRLLAELGESWAKPLHDAQELLIKGGLPPESLEQKSVLNYFCRIRDIAGEADQGGYDAVVLGRRGFSRIQELVDTRTSTKLFREDISSPMLICREPDSTRTNVLACVSGSDSCLGMLDKLAQVVDGETRHAVTLCRIVDDVESEKKRSKEIFEACSQILTERGFPESRIRRMIYPSPSVVQGILDNADWGRFALVGVGRGSARLRNFFGTVTGKLFQELSGAVLWVSG